MVVPEIESQNFLLATSVFLIIFVRNFRLSIRLLVKQPVSSLTWQIKLKCLKSRRNIHIISATRAEMLQTILWMNRHLALRSKMLRIQTWSIPREPEKYRKYFRWEKKEQGKKKSESIMKKVTDNIYSLFSYYCWKLLY